MKTCAWSSEVCTHWPLPDFSRSSSASRMPWAQKMPAVRSAIGNADAHRPVAGLAGDRHQPAHALGDLVEAGPLGVGPVLAEAGDRAVDQARIDRRQALVVDAEAVLDVGR